MTGETVFLDTDIGTDCDDAGAMALLHHLLPGSGMRIGAMVCSAPLPDSPALIRHINAYFGCFCPVGRVQSRAAAGMYRDVYAGEVLRRSGAYQEASPWPKAVPLLRRELSRCPDHSAVYVAIGPQTNMAALLLSPPDEESPLGGRELLERKLRRTVVMAGRFVDETPEYNVLADIGAARLTAADWPGEMTYVPHELGTALITGNGFTEEQYRDNPVAIAYDVHNGRQGRYSWDPVTVYQALKPDNGLFRAGEAGMVSISQEGVSRFSPAPAGRHRLLELKERSETAERVLTQGICTPRGRC
ncbi:MAG TPA: nucleoside hydrolase [Firmicutes bacterium]|nr:nucleoside hydrolase [Bacillota bacterium]